VHKRLEGPLRDRLARKLTTRKTIDGRSVEVELRLARALFAEGWSKERVRAELTAQHRQRRDFRHTGIVRLAEAGATTPQIAGLSGHAIDYTQKILDTYLPRRGDVARGGIEAWERLGEPETKVVSLATRRGSGR
jgi:hypothetical protein